VSTRFRNKPEADRGDRRIVKLHEASRARYEASSQADLEWEREHNADPVEGEDEEVAEGEEEKKKEDHEGQLNAPSDQE